MLKPDSLGFRPLYREGEVNRCPGCGRSQWLVGRASAECAFCATALELPNSDRRPLDVPVLVHRRDFSDIEPCI